MAKEGFFLFAKLHFGRWKKKFDGARLIGWN